MLTQHEHKINRKTDYNAVLLGCAVTIAVDTTKLDIASGVVHFIDYNTLSNFNVVTTLEVSAQQLSFPGGMVSSDHAYVYIDTAGVVNSQLTVPTWTDLESKNFIAIAKTVDGINFSAVEGWQRLITTRPGDYSWHMPDALPGSTSVIQVDTAGKMSYTTAGATVNLYTDDGTIEPSHPTRTITANASNVQWDFTTGDFDVDIDTGNFNVTTTASGGGGNINFNTVDGDWTFSTSNGGQFTITTGFNSAIHLQVVHPRAEFAVGSTATGIRINSEDGVRFRTKNSGVGPVTEVRWYDLDNGQYTGFKAPDTLTGNNIYILPDGDGNPNDFLQTNGSGTLSWAAGGGGGSVTGGDDGVQLNGTIIELGHDAQGSGLSDFTKNRYLYTAGFDLDISTTGRANLMYIDGSLGTMGIGKSNPTQILDIENSAGTDTWVQVSNGPGSVTVLMGAASTGAKLTAGTADTLGLGAGGTEDYLTISTLGALAASQYGGGTITGTAAYSLAVDASGNIIEEALGGANTNMAENNLTADGARNHTWAGNNLTHTFTTGNYTIANTGAADAFVINGTSGAIQFGDYGGGLNTGTATYSLAVDASGNIIEEALGGGSVSGSGAANQIAYWDGASSITGSTDFTYDGSVVNLQHTGTVSANTDFFTLINDANAASMTNTKTGLLWRQYYNDGAPAAADAARITTGTQTNWTATTSTHDAYLDFEVSDGGTMTRMMRIRPDSFVQFGSNGNSIAPAMFTFLDGATSTPNPAGQGLAFHTYETNAINGVSFSYAGEGYAGTSGTFSNVQSARNFQPTSGTANYNNYRLKTTINQTGGANGDTYDLSIEPTFTALGGSYRAINIAMGASTETGIHQSGSGATNYFEGKIGIGIDPPTSALHVFGGGGTNVKIEGTSAGMFTMNQRQVAADGIGVSYTANIAGSYAGGFQWFHRGSASNNDLDLEIYSGGDNGTPVITGHGTGQVGVDHYGTGTFTGTAAYLLAIDASGDIIEEPLATYTDTNMAEDDLTATGARNHTWAANNLTHTFTTGNFTIANTGAADAFVINGTTGAIQIGDYGAGNNTGTATFSLAVDAAGNIIEESLGGVDTNMAEDNLTATGARSHTWTTNNLTHTFTTGNFTIANTGAADAFVINGTTGAVQIGDYGLGNNTGTAAYMLAVDASGNIIEETVGGGGVTGSGATDRIAIWSGASTLTSDAGFTWITGQVLNSAADASILVRSTTGTNDAGIFFENSGDANNSWKVYRDAAGLFTIGLDTAQPFVTSTPIMSIDPSTKYVKFDNGTGDNTLVEIESKGATSPILWMEDATNLWQLSVVSGNFQFEPELADSNFRFRNFANDSNIWDIATSTGIVTQELAGTVKANTNGYTLVNKANAVDMDGTETSLRFQQYYNDGAPAAVDSGFVSVGTETDWTATAGTQDAYLSLGVARNGALIDGLRISSASQILVGNAALNLRPKLYPFTASTITIADPSGQGLGFYSDQGAVANETSFAFAGTAMGPTSGTGVNVNLQRSFAPLSGTAIYHGFVISDTINQTGGANGITSSVNINPTLTAAADYRAIWIQNNSGAAIYQSGASAINYFAGNVGIGQATPGELLTLEDTGTAKANLDIVSITNTTNAADMDGTSSSILFNQYYYDVTTPALVDQGRITYGTETDWTSTASTQDAYFSLTVAVDGTLTERLRIDSDGGTRISGYGLGTHTGTAAYSLAVDSSGNIIEEAVGGGGSGLTLTTESSSASQTAAVGDLMAINTTINAVTVTPPSTPSADDRFGIIDTRSNAGTNNITVDFTTATQKYYAASEDATLQNDRVATIFRYVNSTVGWINESTG